MYNGNPSISSNVDEFDVSVMLIISSFFRERKNLPEENTMSRLLIAAQHTGIYHLFTHALGTDT